MKHALCALAALSILSIRASAQTPLSPEPPLTLESAFSAARAQSLDRGFARADRPSMGDESRASRQAGAPAEEYPQQAACEQALLKYFTWATPLFRGADGKLFRGFSAVGYSQSRMLGVSLVLLTDSAAYYYSESCDICADVDRVDLKTGKVSSALAAHSIDCEDMARFKAGKVVYDSCPARTAALRCGGKGGADSAITGTLDLATMGFDNSRSQDRSPLIDTARSTQVVDDRCGATRLPLADSLNYYVTPRHYWGEDILQLPKDAARASGSFKANLHTCQYDGAWSASEDTELDCTLTLR